MVIERLEKIPWQNKLTIFRLSFIIFGKDGGDDEDGSDMNGSRTDGEVVDEANDETKKKSVAIEQRRTHNDSYYTLALITLNK